MKVIYGIFFALLVLCSCSDDNCISFGEIEYYPPFLWVDSHMSPLNKTIEFCFSQDAKNDPTCFAEFQFVDNDGNPISTDVMQISVDGNELPDNKLRIDNSVSSKELVFTFSPQAEDGEHQGYLKLISHNLDRLDSEQLSLGQQLEVFQWTINYKKSMNPLAKGLMWFVISLVSCIMIWKIFIRPLIYPHFKKFSKSILIEQNGTIVGQMNFSFKGARKVVFSNTKQKQSFWQKFFVGETKTLVSPLFQEKIIFSPRQNGKSAAVLGTGYMANPNPIPRNGEAKITNIHQKITITVR